MKQLFCLITVTIVLALTASCTTNNVIIDTQSSQSDHIASNSALNFVELRGVWISYSELSKAFDGNFYDEIDSIFDNIVNLGFNAAFVHVRPFCDAFYNSELFPWSSYISGTQGTAPGFDPFEYIVSAARKRNIEIHAWINPYRVSYSTENPNSLADSSPVKQYMSAHPNSNFAVAHDGGLYLNPANSDAEKLIIDGVKEIINGYDVDGIHFDDYFYPTTKESFDKSDYVVYCSANANALPLADWRRENVNHMLKSVYKAIKNYKMDIQFGVSPAGNNELNYDQLYADTDAWIKGGYIDYIIPQLYFGCDYKTENLQYDNLVYQWSKCRDDVTLYAGLGAYKIGAGYDSEKAEWSSGCILEKQINYARAYKYKGFVIFSYSSLFSDDPLNTRERKRIYNLIGED